MEGHDYLASGENECGVCQQAFETVGRTAAADIVPAGQRGTRPLVVYHCEPYTAHILPPLEEKPLADWLERKFMLHPEDAADIAHRSEGSLTKAMENISLGDEQRMYFESFVSLMRLAYKRDIRQLKAWSEQVSSLGRERQKGLLVYCQRMIRENFMFNFHASDLSYLSPDERQFATRFSPYINEKNVMPVMELLEEAQLHVGQNVNSKMVFFDVALRMIVLLIR